MYDKDNPFVFSRRRDLSLIRSAHHRRITYFLLHAYTVEYEDRGMIRGKWESNGNKEKKQKVTDLAVSNGINYAASVPLRK